MPEYRISRLDWLLLSVGLAILVIVDIWIWESGVHGGYLSDVAPIASLVGPYLALYEMYRFSRRVFEVFPIALLAPIIALGAIALITADLLPYGASYPASPSAYLVWNFFMPVVCATLVIIVATTLAMLMESRAWRAALFAVILPGALFILLGSASHPYTLPNFQFMFFLILSPVLVWSAISELASEEWETLHVTSRAVAIGLTLAGSIPFTLLMVAPWAVTGFSTF